MLNGSMPTPARKSSTARIALFVGLGGAAFVLGIGVTLSVVTFKNQQQQLARMTDLVEQLAQRDAEEAVSRATTAGLIALEQIAVQPAAVVVPEPAPVISAEPAAEPATGKIEALVNAALPTQAAEAPEDWKIKNAERIETLAIIQAGVQELAAAVVADEYEITSNYEDEHFKGRIHFAFVGYEKDQTELELYLADAAERGIIAHSQAVVSGGGKVNGHILLFDLVERALQNGTDAERAAGKELQGKAMALMAKEENVGEPLTAAGEKFYVVEPGDSLAYIALQFYGNTVDFARIFEANRDKLKTPDRIQVGQRLLIPTA